MDQSNYDEDREGLRQSEEEEKARRAAEVEQVQQRDFAAVRAGEAIVVPIRLAWLIVLLAGIGVGVIVVLSLGVIRRLW